MGHHDAIPNGTGSSNPRLNLKTNSWSVVILVLMASFCSCSYNIYEAAHWGNTKKVEAYLNGGVDINTPNRWGRTPLAIALFRKHYDTAKLLIEKGAQINVVDPLRHVPIILYPVIDGNLEMTRFLIDHGADVNQADPKGYTALIEAAYHGHTEIGRLLIEHGADIQAATVGNVTALSNARGRNHKAFEKMLVDTIEHREREALLYRRAKRDATIPAFEAYLKNYPKGKYAKEAQSVKTSQTMWSPQPLRL
jgi:ankyrin repeat protein